MPCQAWSQQEDCSLGHLDIHCAYANTNTSGGPLVVQVILGNYSFLLRWMCWALKGARFTWKRQTRHFHFPQACCPNHGEQEVSRVFKLLCTHGCIQCTGSRWGRSLLPCLSLTTFWMLVWLAFTIHPRPSCGEKGNSHCPREKQASSGGEAGQSMGCQGQ